MAIFLDSGDIKEIERFNNMGIIRGVTTNPTILLKNGISGGLKELRSLFTEIAGIIHPYPLSVEVTTNEMQGMIDQAKEIAGWADNMVVKVPVHGPEGELENLEVIHTLEKKYKIQVNVTAMMSAQQCLLAALAGASYVSLFGGRVNNMGYNVCSEIRILRDLLDDFSLPTKIILGSTREVLNVVEWLHEGAHIVTVVPKLLEGMIVHPYTKETVRMFLKDAGKIKKEKPGK